MNDYSPYRGGLGHGGYDKNVVMEFYPENQYANNDSNWWVPTLACLGQMARAAGFDEVSGWKLTETPDHLSKCRDGRAAGKSATHDGSQSFRSGVASSLSSETTVPGT